ERAVAREEVEVLKGGALVEDFVGGKWIGHGSPSRPSVALSRCESLWGRAYQQRIEQARGSRCAGLAGGSGASYRGRFNDQSRNQGLLRAPASADVREFIGGRDRCPARPGGQGGREQPPDQQEARRAARPHADQPVLRGLDANAELLRARRQA